MIEFWNKEKSLDTMVRSVFVFCDIEIKLAYFVNQTSFSLLKDEI